MVEYAKEKDKKNMTNLAKCHGILLAIIYVIICLYNALPKVVLYCTLVFYEMVLGEHSIRVNRLCK